MAAFKVGDRVRVQFDATVLEPTPDQDGDLALKRDVEGFSAAFVRAEHCTLIEPEYEEGAMYVDTDGDFYVYWPDVGEERPWFEPGYDAGHRFDYPTRPLRRLVPES